MIWPDPMVVYDEQLRPGSLKAGRLRSKEK